MHMPRHHIIMLMKVSARNFYARLDCVYTKSKHHVPLDGAIEHTWRRKVSQTCRCAKCNEYTCIHIQMHVHLYLFSYEIHRNRYHPTITI